VAASSRALAERMVASIPADRAVRVVELGPGTGPFTRALAGRVAAGSHILAIDLEQTFIDRLKGVLPSVDFVCGSAADLEHLVAERQLAPVDHIISGLPFASLPTEVTRCVLDGIERTLRPGGTFTTFQYLHAYGMRPGRIFRREITRRMGGLTARHLVIRNFPPAFVLIWTRPGRP
jgi:phosphatidylethanolamine/phosphatidyl-N-methylethanolamine N-methyltransferase